MMAIKAAIAAQGEARRRNVVLVPDSAHGTNPATAALIGFTASKPCPRRPDGTRRSVEDVKALLGPEVAAIMLTNPNTCGLFERDSGRDRRGDARGRRLFLLRRRQLQRHRRRGAARRSRRRRHAHQPAQDLLDPAWRRRARRRAGGAVAARSRLRAAALRAWPARSASSWWRTRPRRRRGQATRSAACAPSTARWACFVRALAYMLCQGADGLAQASERRGAQRQLHPRRPRRPDVAALRRPALHARGCCSTTRWLEGTGVTHPRFRQGDDRRGLPSDDDVFPAGRARRHADRADRDRNRRPRSTSSSPRCGRSPIAAKAGDVARFNGAPFHAPLRRLDETRAARQPKLAWRPEPPVAVAGLGRGARLIPARRDRARST